MSLPTLDLFSLQGMLNRSGKVSAAFLSAKGRTPTRRLRVLVIGTSETNRRRTGSHGAKGNVTWSNELRARYQVMGYWPAILMHHIDAQVMGIPSPSLDDLSDFARLLYLFERNRIHRFRCGDLWNTATPGGNSEYILHMLRRQHENLTDFNADLVVICGGGGDRNASVARCSGADLMELGPIKGLGLEEQFEFQPCEEPEVFEERMCAIAGELDRIQPAALKVYLGIPRLVTQSRRSWQFSLEIDQVVRRLAADRGHGYVGFDFIPDTPQGAQEWLMTDNHPTDQANELLAMMILENIGSRLVQRVLRHAPEVLDHSVPAPCNVLLM